MTLKRRRARRPGRAPSRERDGQALFARATQLALEAIGSAAFLIRKGGAVVLANEAGRELLKRDGEQLEHALEDCLSGRSEEFIVHPIVAQGMPLHYLAVRRDSLPDTTTRALEAARRWGLTPRQTEVLVLLVAGETNKGIAARLGCAEKTVEIHVTQILARSRLPGRAAVIAALWTHGRR